MPVCCCRQPSGVCLHAPTSPQLSQHPTDLHHCPAGPASSLPPPCPAPPPACSDPPSALAGGKWVEVSRDIRRVLEKFRQEKVTVGEGAAAQGAGAAGTQADAGMGAGGIMLRLSGGFECMLAVQGCGVCSCCSCLSLCCCLSGPATPTPHLSTLPRPALSPHVHCPHPPLAPLCAGAGDGQGASVKYLSSSRLMGLQLRDATFRRHFLLQCLILMQASQGICCRMPAHRNTR